MDSDDLAKELLHYMHLIQKARNQKLIQEGIQGEAFILHFIKKQRNGVIPGQISESLGISSARVATVLNSLEGKGFITRKIDNDDMRRIIVELTEKGIEQADEQRKRHMKMMKNILMRLGEEDAKEYVRITGKLAGIFSEDRC
jgi:DNA-binding MarR family transcriptional regulator